MDLLEMGIWVLDREQAGDCLAELVNDYNLLCAKIQGAKKLLAHAPANGLARVLDA